MVDKPYDNSFGGYVDNVAKDQLEARRATRETRGQTEYSGYGRRIYDYYGMGLGGPV